VSYVQTLIAELVEKYGRYRPYRPYRGYRTKPGGPNPSTTVDEVLSRTRRRPAVEVRWTCWYVLYELCSWTETAIGRVFQVGHSSVSEGLAKVRLRPDLLGMVG